MSEAIVREPDFVAGAVLQVMSRRRLVNLCGRGQTSYKFRYLFLFALSLSRNTPCDNARHFTQPSTRSKTFPSAKSNMTPTTATRVSRPIAPLDAALN